ncbi:uncharacterized protein LOC114579203 [Dendrobium catenatum]|uniref:uncharacterized protein LOC114579203 n=1 Tax=Dendrobium catenatum TaxID=906689 RepID=UPI00109F63C9|nr:uncharacterized protein LOC114579203 [Dendrobium catenatum]
MAFKQRGAQLGIRIVPHAERISHLLHADDILVFAEASRHNADRILNILDDYCGWTGQCVNREKSAILFNKRCPKWKQRAIARVVGVRRVDQFDYLGIPLVLRKLKVADFATLVRSAHDKTNIWGKKYLSYAGRALLIRSALLTIPAYLLAHTEVPSGVLNSIEKLGRRFLWQKDSNRGLGFHELAVWRGPLRARLAWTVINEPDSLLHKVVTAKYGADLWLPVRTPKCSATWRIIREGADALSTILRWRIGDGRSVRILHDCWILDRKIEEWLTFVNVEEVENARVCNLLTDSLEWNVEMVNHFFGPILAQRILEIGTNVGEGTDTPELTKSCFGSSLSAVAYRSKVQGPDCDFGWLHNLKLQPREKFHWWRLLWNAIPTNVWLHRRGLSSTRLYPWGCDMEENTDHCITLCHMLRKVVRILAKWGFALPQFDSLAAAMDGVACQERFEAYWDVPPTFDYCRYGLVVIAADLLDANSGALVLPSALWAVF